MARAREPEELLSDIVLWGGFIAQHVRGMDLDAFSQDLRTQHAVAKCIEVIGEASGQLMKAEPSYAAKLPELDLRKAYVTRNKLSHGYFDTNIEILWLTATEAVPVIAAAAAAALAGLPQDDDA